MLLLRAVVTTAVATTAMSGAVAYYVHETRGVGWLGIVALVLGGMLAGCGIGVLMWWLAGATGRGVVQLLTSAGNLPPEPSFSYQESLIVRGRHAEAAVAFKEHLAANPTDDAARIALGELLAGPLADPAGAERLYLGVRGGRPSPRHEWVVAQLLIELYRKTGQEGRHLAELARFADRYRGTPAGDAAKRELMERKREQANPAEH